MYRPLTAMLVFASMLVAMPSEPTLHGQTAKPSSQPLHTPTPLLPEATEKPASEESTHEDWTTIQLAESGLPLKATGGVPLSKIEMQGCTREMLRLQWRPVDPIDLYVIRPHVVHGVGLAKPPVVLFLYDYTLDTELFRADRWCEKAKQNGVTVVGFASALSWQRFHAPRPMKQWFVSELQEALATSTHDVQMVLNYLETRGDLDTQHIGMFGQGSGGAIAILAAAADPRIRALDLMDPWGDWPDWIKGSKQIPDNERATYLQPAFLERVANLDPVTYLPLLTGRTLRVQQVLTDSVTPLAAKDKIAASVPDAKQMTRYPDRAAAAAALGSNGIVGWLSSELTAHQSHTESVSEDSIRSEYSGSTVY